MKTIYIATDNKCHVTNDGTMTAYDTDFFDGKCDEYIEGYCCVIDETGVCIYPWKPYVDLIQTQVDYECEELNRLRMEKFQYESALAEIEAALGVTTE